MTRSREHIVQGPPLKSIDLKSSNKKKESVMNWQEEREEQNKEIDTVIAENNLTLKCYFIPLSQSRNSQEKDDRGNPQISLNWKVTLLKDNIPVLTTDYMQGIGHAPNYPNTWNQDRWSIPYFREVAESGETLKTMPRQRKHFKKDRKIIWYDANASLNANCGHGKMNREKVPNPDIKDVLYSLLMDSDVLNHSGFEEWADNFGYEMDSRKAESIYKACMEIALQLKNGIGYKLIEQLQESFQDY